MKEEDQGDNTFNPNMNGGATPQPNKCRAGDGITWFTLGFQVVLGNPLMWIGIALVVSIATSLIIFMPFIGQVLAILLYALVYAGLMLGCRDQTEGGQLQISHALAVIDEKYVGRLLTFYALSTIHLLGIMTIAWILLSLLGLRHFTLGGVGALGLLFDPRGWIIIILTGGFLIHWGMRLSYACPLILFKDITASEAMRLSLTGCLRNIRPMIVLLIIFMIISSAFSAFSSLFNSIPYLGAVIAAVISSVLWAANIAITYCSFQAIFEPDESSTENNLELNEDSNNGAASTTASS